MQQKMMLIVNPFSGRGISKSALGTIVTELCSSEYVVSVYFAGTNTVEELAFMYSGLHDLVVCVGGDGTLSSVVSGILRSGSGASVGYIPAGTANDVASTLAISRNLSSAAQSIISGKEKALDIGDFGGRYFTYIAAFGAFTGVAYRTSSAAKRALGQFAYVLGGLGEAAAIKPQYTVVEYDEGVIEGDYIFGAVVNSTSVAGFVKLDQNLVNLADGLFEVILVRKPLHLPDFLVTMNNISSRTYNGDNVIMLHSSNVKFRFETDVAWTVDGEYGGDHKNVEVKNCHEAIKIIV